LIKVIFSRKRINLLRREEKNRKLQIEKHKSLRYLQGFYLIDHENMLKLIK